MKRLSLAAVLHLPLGALALAALTLSAGCQNAAPTAAPDAPRTALPALPAELGGWSRQLSDTTLVVPGTAAYMSSGLPGVYETGAWLTLDGDFGGEMAWAVWRFPLPEENNLEDIKVNLANSGFKQYWVFWGDFAQDRWVMDGDEAKFGISVLSVPPALTLRSPGNFVYLALAVLPGNKINVDTLDFTHDGTGPGPDEPIFDQFENNEPMEFTYELAPGMHLASIHETWAPMSDPAEWRDRQDFYKITLGPGQHLTATLRYEVFDHFVLDFPNINDLDLLFYNGPTEEPLNDFVEALSSMRIYYHPMEQVDFDSPGGQTVYLGLVADLDGPDVNAEYELGLFVSDAVYEVSGYVTQEGEIPDWDYVVFLTPGNFNAVTTWTVEGQPNGLFTIKGVPNGTYDLWAHYSSRNPTGPYDYIWPEHVQVVVNNANVAGVNLDIGPHP